MDSLYGPEATTSQIYDDLVKPLVPWAWGGGIGTMFAYGQTSSGKTLTVSGLERHVADTLMDGSLEGERKISVSIIELAGQTAYGKASIASRLSVLTIVSHYHLQTSSTTASRFPSWRTHLV